jgi:hypothetical protein
VTDRWQTRAACKGMNPEQVAPTHCQRCPVRHECLWEALSDVDWHRQQSYTPACTWGGYPASTRRAMMADADVRFRPEIAYQKFLKQERENNGPSYKLPHGNTRGRNHSRRNLKSVGSQKRVIESFDPLWGGETPYVQWVNNLDGFTGVMVSWNEHA